MPSVKTNHSLSVDCVVFGFDGHALKVLLVERSYHMEGVGRTDEKLPGRMILENESLSISAQRILEEMTGLKNVYLHQFHIFSDPQRVTSEELKWINEYHGIFSDRVVTVAYYGLVKLNDGIISRTTASGAYWADVDEVKVLALDHMHILSMALSVLYKEMITSPIAFELLPRKFTIHQLRMLYSAVLGVEPDSRNFRKKILSSGFLSATGEKEKGVAHKPAEYFTFNKNAYKRAVKAKNKLGFINNWNY